MQDYPGKHTQNSINKKNDWFDASYSCEQIE